jgi:hypothetical protein
MPLPVVNLFSEPYSPTGNVAADGVRKLLGAPRLDLLQTLVREAVQNSCDAAKLGRGPRVLFRLRRLTSDQRETMRDVLLAELPEHKPTAKPVRDFLKTANPWVLEICDFGTTGLGGPTRADKPIPEGDQSDFVDFIRNIGSKRNTDLGGGTYGYGKSALYLASSCGLIVVDSQTTHGSKSVRRLIAAQLGEAFDAGPRRSKRFTGRHWWGRIDPKDDFVEPVEGRDAVGIARALGFPERGPDATGTSIMILAPQFLADNKDEVVGALKEALLWYFWPRMMEDVSDSRRLRVEIELDGVVQELPAPEQVPPLELFCEAMREVRQNGNAVQSVESQRPAAVLGRLCIVKGARGNRQPLRPPANLVREGGESSSEPSLFPDVCRHIAVMRPVELVVRYFDDGEPLPREDHEWAGVFVTSEDPAIEKAFADSEPPAHDDWQPEMLPAKSPGRRYVNIALKRIRDAGKAVAGGSQPARGGGVAGPSLAHVADIFGRALGSTNLQGGAPRTSTSGRVSGGGNKRYSVSRPRFERLEELDGVPVAIFKSEVRNSGRQELTLKLEPALVVDGGAAAGEFSGRATPRVVDVRDADGAGLGSGTSLPIGMLSGELHFAVTMPGDGAVTVKARLEEGNA